jgi:hypothetical protein
MNIGDYVDSPIYSFDTVYGTLVLNEQNFTTIKNMADKYNIPPDILLGVVASEMDFDHDLKDYVQDALGRENIAVGQGQGVASVHSDTLDDCIKYLKDQKLPTGEYAEEYDRSVDNLASFKGSVEGAAIITAALYYYKGGANTLEDKAVIWGGYRSGVKGLTPPGPDGYGYLSKDDFKNNRANGAGDRNDGLEIGRNAYMSQPYFELFDRVIKIDESIDGRTGPVDHLDPPYA